MPYVSVWVEDSDVLDEIDDDDLISALKKRGYSVSRSISENLEGINRIDHLYDCGMADQARKEALMLVGNAIGRPL